MSEFSELIMKRQLNVGDIHLATHKLNMIVNISGFVEFILKYGASHLIKNEISIWNSITELEILFGFSNNIHYDIFHQYKTYRYRIPKQKLPFASLVCGDLLLINSKGHVEYWDHELNDNYEIKHSKQTLPIVTTDYQSINSLIITT